MSKLRHPDQAGLHLRVVLRGGALVGPGRADLLAGIARHGSIAAAGREMGMSYRRAWTLVADIAAQFGAPVVVTAPGGAKGGGAALTELGEAILRLYRDIERKSTAAAAADIDAMQRLVAIPGPDKKETA